MKSKWASRIGWALLIFFALAAGEKSPEAAIFVLIGVVIYWARRIEAAIKALKE